MTTVLAVFPEFDPYPTDDDHIEPGVRWLPPCRHCLGTGVVMWRFGFLVDGPPFVYGCSACGLKP